MRVCFKASLRWVLHGTNQTLQPTTNVSLGFELGINLCKTELRIQGQKGGSAERFA